MSYGFLSLVFKFLSHFLLQAPFGSVYCFTQDKKMVLVENGYWFPNGIAVKHSEDNKPELLIVAETPQKTLWAFDITAPGAVEKKRIWGKIPGHGVNFE